MVFFDTNVLVTASDRKRAGHDQANGLLAAGANVYPNFKTSGQVLREYYCVATRSSTVNGLGLRPKAACESLVAFLAVLDLVEESKASMHILLRLADREKVSGKQIHDANIVATMLSCKCENLVTLNGRDFQRFSEIRTFTPEEASTAFAYMAE